MEWFGKLQAAISAEEAVPIKTASSIAGDKSNDLASIVNDLQSAICLSAITHRVAKARGVQFSSLSTRAFGNVALSGAKKLKEALHRTAAGKAEWDQLVVDSETLRTTPLIILAARGLGEGVAASLLAGQQELWAYLLCCKADVAQQRKALMTHYDVEEVFKNAEDAEGVRRVGVHPLPSTPSPYSHRLL